MTKLILSAGAALFCWSAGACAGVITSAGSTTVQPAMKACAKAYKKTHPNIQFIIAGGGSGKGVKTIGRGKVDIGRASRAIKAKELAKYPDMKTFKIGTDGVALVVNKANPLASISSDQVEKLFTGAIGNWKELGGDDAAVHLISLGAEHGTYELFSKRFHLEGVEQDGNLIFGQGHAWIAFSQDIALNKLAHDSHAITFASVGIASDYAKNSDVKVLPLDGVEPTAAHVADGEYRLSRPLLVMTKGEPQGEIKDFIDYMQAAECQAIVKKLGYIPVR